MIKNSVVGIFGDNRRDTGHSWGKIRGCEPHLHGGKSAMETLFQRLFMPDEVPTPLKGVYIFVEMLALGAVLKAFDEFEK